MPIWTELQSVTLHSSADFTINRVLYVLNILVDVDHHLWFDCAKTVKFHWNLFYHVSNNCASPISATKVWTIFVCMLFVWFSRLRLNEMLHCSKQIKRKTRAICNKFLLFNFWFLFLSFVLFVGFFLEMNAVVFTAKKKKSGSY